MNEYERFNGFICVQAFHWMNPEITLKEVNRILKPKQKNMI